MRYKCKDCGAIFDRKIEYCDCGNNTFDIIDESPVKARTRQAVSLPQGEIVSRIFFALCVLLSFIILFLPVKTVRNTSSETAVETKAPKEIPDIDKIWKNPAPAAVEQEPAPVVIIQKIIKRTEVPQTIQPTPTKPKPVTPPAPATKPKQQTVSHTTSQAQQVTQQPSTQNKPASNSQAVIRYKNALREMLLSKLAVATISGEGTCIIKFRVDENGKLIERGFVQYANNKQMNDAIYYMLMSVPKFQPPPSDYNGEVIRLQFYINNGEYEISFK